MIHRRRDLGSPLLTVWLMKRAWPRPELVLVDEAGHDSDRMTSELVRATDRSRANDRSRRAR